MDGRMDCGFVLRDVSSLSFGETERQRNFKQKHLDVDETFARAAQFNKLSRRNARDAETPQKT